MLGAIVLRRFPKPGEDYGLGRPTKTDHPGLHESHGLDRAVDRGYNRFEINNTARLAAFLAQVAVESGQLNRLEENLNYSVLRLMQVWPGRFLIWQVLTPTLAIREALQTWSMRTGLATEILRVAMAGLSVAEASCKSPGAATIEKWARISDWIWNLNPTCSHNPRAAALPAAFFWKSKGLNELADQQTDQSFEKNHIDYQWRNDRVRRPQEVLANREKNTLWRVID